MNSIKNQSKQSISTSAKWSYNYNDMDDAQLVRLCQVQDKVAFDILLKRNQRYINSLLSKLAPGWNDTSDLAQETHIRIWTGIAKLKNPKALKSWISQIVTNLFYDELRRRPQHIISLDAPVSADDDSNLTRDVEDSSSGPEELYDSKTVLKSVDEAIATLPAYYRAPLALRDVHDLPYEEIARLTCTDLGTVKSRISRARKKVQVILRPQFRPEIAA